ncbi:MAG TPA: glycosyl hydrolase [Chitinophagaceae bacterium]|nr:glycosyl hydrolase [Chitinophagaceae bacterium]
MSPIKKSTLFFVSIFILVLSGMFSGCAKKPDTSSISALRTAFLHPPDSARPGVYWYFMDGNMSKEGMKKDLLSMKKAGIGRVVFLEVNVGVPRGPVDFLSDQWYGLFKYMETEAEKLGINITLGVGPGWAGSGGPWITPAESMQQLVSSTTRVTGPGTVHITLPLPEPKTPYFGEGILTPVLKKKWEDYYKDVAVLAFPTPEGDEQLKDINEKALYYRAPFSSVPGVKPFLYSWPDTAKLPAGALIPEKKVINLAGKLHSDGTLDWKVPEGRWTIMRFVSRNNGALTRPAPVQGLGFECNKLDTTAVNVQLDAYVGKILAKLGKLNRDSPGGLKMLHLDSWEMGAQNWTAALRNEFKKRRGYDPLPFYPVYGGKIVGSREISNRFLWDLRQTCNELVREHYAGQLKAYAHRHGFGLSIEPYDMNPSADLELGSVADIPMSEFWSKGFGFNTAFSCIEATSIAHVEGEPIVQSEAFTSDGHEAWQQYPGSMKDQGDWALATGINRFYYHTFAHKPLADSLRPGMTMGPYGVHWDRKQTWWPMVGAYHRYITRCQFILQQGKAVADVLYLTPEGAPQVFLPPPTALRGDTLLPDRRGYNFDGCSPLQLYKATVSDHQVVFPGGASYRLLVLPAVKTMTPVLLDKIISLVKAGAVVVGAPPLRSPSLSGYPACDGQVRRMADTLWGGFRSPAAITARPYGKGEVIWGGAVGVKKGKVLYPDYDLTSGILTKWGVTRDFSASVPVRYTHRTTADWDIYFVSNPADHPVKFDATFRTAKGAPALWNPLTGKTRRLPRFSTRNGQTTIPLALDRYQSYFIVFAKSAPEGHLKGLNFPGTRTVDTLKGSWRVSFDPKWGGPASITFDHLVDWTTRPEKGIRYYSGVATYHKSFDLPASRTNGDSGRLYLNLGAVKDLARVLLNGHDLGVVWTAPRRVDITGVIKQKGNQLEIRVANRWPNRLIGDQQFPDDGVKDDQWPAWLLKGQKRPSKRYTFTNYNPYTENSPLLQSGLLGPVTIQSGGF